MFPGGEKSGRDHCVLVIVANKDLEDEFGLLRISSEVAFLAKMLLQWVYMLIEFFIILKNVFAVHVHEIFFKPVLTLHHFEPFDSALYLLLIIKCPLSIEQHQSLILILI